MPSITDNDDMILQFIQADDEQSEWLETPPRKSEEEDEDSDHNDNDYNHASMLRRTTRPYNRRGLSN